MRKQFIVLLTLLMAAASCIQLKQDHQDPAMYVSRVDSMVAALKGIEDNLGNSYHTSDSSQIETAYQNALKGVSDLYIAADKMGAYEKDSALYTATKEYFYVQSQVYGTHYRRIVSLIESGSKTDEDFAMFELLFHEVKEAQNDAREHLEQAKKKFSEAYMKPKAN